MTAVKFYNSKAICIAEFKRIESLVVTNIVIPYSPRGEGFMLIDVYQHVPLG